MQTNTTAPAALNKVGGRLIWGVMQSNSRADPPWKKWYKSRRWQALRIKVLVRDSYQCQKCGRICDGLYPADDSPVADHIKAHRGSERLFWDKQNIQTLCKAPCHDQMKQAEEQASRAQMGAWY